MNTIDLSGKWKLKLDPSKNGIENKYFENCDFKDELNLPGTVSEQKKSPENNLQLTGSLTDPYLYEGWIWLNKEINLVEFQLNNSLNDFEVILERTRYTTLWINGKEIGSNNSLNGKHEYNFSLSEQEVKSNLKITILVSNTDYIVPGGHMTSPDTQTNWIGITGKIQLIQLDHARLTNIKIETKVSDSIKLNISTELTGDENKDFTFEIPEILNETKTLSPGHNELSFDLTDKVEAWSAINPVLYELKILNSVTKSEYKYKIGFRTFTAREKHFEINGNKVFLRGKHDGMIFPKTGYAPTDFESWKKILQIAKSYGINHYRFHTCCPPEAAFEAADYVGIYMSPELPFWGTIQAPGEEGFNQLQQEYLITEGYKILDNFGNHPSFVMMSMGNELWGSEKRLDDIISEYKTYDSRHLYTGGSNNFQFFPRTTANEDYFVGVRFSKEALIRGSYAMCDAPLGFIQTEEPNTDHDYDKFFLNSNALNQKNEDQEIEIQYGTGVKKVKANSVSEHFIPNKPCISHEVGQYYMYPNYDEIDKYSGVLKPYNYIEFKNRLDKTEMKNQAKAFFENSSKLAVQCYKTEIEAALRSNELSGFQLLDIQDFTGQGTAVVGILDSFMESKNIVEPSQWKSFCNDTVLLASFDKYVYEENECLRSSIILHNYSNDDFFNQFVTVYIINTEDDEILCEESFEINESIKGNIDLGVFTYKFENIKSYKKLALILILQDENDEEKSFVNSYIFHIYPKTDDEIETVLNKLKNNDQIEYKDCLITKESAVASEKTKEYRKILLIPDEVQSSLPGFNKNEKIESVEGTYCTDFWCYTMFKSISESMNKPVPTGTLGLLIDKESDLFKDFPTDTYTTPKWYNIIAHSNCINLSGKNINPEIQMIDNVERNWKLGLLYQQENIIICTSRLWEISDKPEVSQFVKSLLN